MRRDLNMTHKRSVTREIPLVYRSTTMDANGLRDDTTAIYTPDEKPKWVRFISGGEIG